MPAWTLHLQEDTTMKDVMALLSAFLQGDEHAGEKLVAMFAGLLQLAQYDSLTGLS